MILKILKTFLIIVISGIIAISAWEYWESTHRINFKIDDKYRIDLFADECGMCFLDWQIDFKIKITDLRTNKKYKHKFWMGNGPYSEFGIPKDEKEELLIRGYDYNGMHNWLIDFKKNEIDEMSSVKEIEEAKEEYVFKHKLNGNFEIEEM